MEPTQYGRRHDPAELGRAVLVESNGDALLDTLMWPGVVVVVNEFSDEAMQLVALENEHVIQAFPLEAADEPLTIGVGFLGLKWSLEFLDTTADGNCRESLAVLAVAIADEGLGGYAPGRGFAELLGSPTIGGRGSDCRVYDPAGSQFQDDKDVKRTKEQIVNDGEVAGPDVSGVILEESGPRLA